MCAERTTKPTLKETLAQAEEQQLHQLSQLWGLEALDGQDRQQTERALLAQMQRPFFARGVWLGLSIAARRCLYTILSAPTKKGLLHAQLEKKTKLPPAEVERAVAELQVQWLISTTLVHPPIPLHGPRLGREEAVSILLPAPECAEVLTQTGHELMLPGGDRSRWELRSLLAQLPWDTIEALARLCSVSLQTYELWRPVPVSDVQVRTQLRQRLETSPALFALLRRLDPQAQHLWIWLWEHGRTAPLGTVQQALGLSMSDLAWLIPSLEAHALAFETLTPTGERLVFLPMTFYEQLLPEVKRWQVEEQIHAWLPLEEAPANVRTTPPTLLYDLAVVIGWAYQQVLEPTKDGRLPKRLQAQIRPRLQGQPRTDEMGQDGYPDLLLRAATELHLLQRVTPYEGAKPRYAPGPALTAWGQATFEEQTKRFLAWWQASTEWQDLLPDQRSLPAYHWTSQDRTYLLDQLRRCEVGRWYRITSLLYVLWKATPIDLSAERVRAGATPFTLLQSQYERWRERAGQRVLGILTSTLVELGLVELAWEDTNAARLESTLPVAVRLTPLGAAALSLVPSVDDASSPSASNALIVQPSFELVLLKTRLPLLYQLMPWTEVTQVGVASTLRLTQRSILQGLAHVGHLEELLALLKAASGRELPQNIDYSLREWARKHKGTLLAPVFLLAVSSEEVAQEVAQVLAEHRIHVQPLSAQLLAVQSDLTNLGAVHRYLEQAGITVQRGMPRGRVL